MNKRIPFLLVALIALANAIPPEAQARLEVAADIHITATSEFHSPLAAHGTWVEVGTYGQCWRPVGVSVGWRPYCEGQWVWTDCGWYWESDEPWAWACYHYGNWVLDPVVGWVWVPGVDWAPAWVTWRYGGGYCGWAPLPPHGVVLAPRYFAFVEFGHFHERIHSSKVIVNNVTIINKTKVHGGPQKESRKFASAGPREVMINAGPGLQTVEKATGERFKAESVQKAYERNAAPRDVERKPKGQDGAKERTGRDNKRIDKPSLDNPKKSGKPGAADIDHGHGPKDHKPPKGKDPGGKGGGKGKGGKGPK